MKTSATDRPWGLRVEHLDDAFGIDTRRPRLSWKLPPFALRQHAYRVEAGDWDSGWVESGESTLVEYGGPELRSRQRIAWRVQVRTETGVSAWSDPAAWEMGLLSAREWSARFIEPEEPEVGAAGFRRAQLLRTAWDHSDGFEHARIYATAHGVYELFLNGARVGDAELTPGFTSYGARLAVQTFDIGHLLVPGRNELRALVSDGWWRGQVGYTREHDVYGSSLGLLAQVEIDGRVVVATGADWESAPSGIVADLMQGQSTDLRVNDSDLAWSPVRVSDASLDALCVSEAPAVRRVELVRPRTVTYPRGDSCVVDLGQNINGWLRLNKLPPRDVNLTITHGEALDAGGDVTTEHLNAVEWQTQQPIALGQIDVVVSDGSDQAFEPRHTTHGFQYARIEGAPTELGVDDVAGVVVHTDLLRTGWFSCSDPRLNRLHEAADWSFRTNACDIPTDCPQRERAGWTGDWQIFAPTAAFLYDVAGFSTKWLRDLAADQRDDGAVRNFAPDPAPPAAQNNAIKIFLEASAGWGDAAVLVPWAMWRAYGDRRLLEEQWLSMVAWVEYEATTAREKRHPSRIERSAEPAVHEEFLWDTGHHWGEWCEPDGADDHFEHIGDDYAIIATAYFAHSARLLSEIARVLDRVDDAAIYAALAENVVAAWRTEFIDGDGNVRSERQADQVRALAFDLVPESLRAQTAERLVKLIRDNGTHLNTGFLATPMLLPTLAEHGHLDVAYDLLLQDTPPSWLTMVDRGATTIWEHWEGIDDRGAPHASLNHYSKGAVISFLHEYVAGIRVLDDGPGYRRFLVAPMPGGGLTAADAAHESPYGRIESSWTIVDDEMRLTVRVPPNTTAEVRMPDGSARVVGAGTVIFTGAWRTP